MSSAAASGTPVAGNEAIDPKDGHQDGHGVSHTSPPPKALGRALHSALTHHYQDTLGVSVYGSTGGSTPASAPGSPRL